MDATLILKILGASLGSSIAVVFKPGGDGWLKLIQRFVIGAIIGVIAAPILIDWLKWELQPDYWVAAAALGGLVGYLVLQVLFSDATVEIIKNRVKK